MKSRYPDRRARAKLILIFEPDAVEIFFKTFFKSRLFILKLIDSILFVKSIIEKLNRIWINNPERSLR